MTEGFNRRRMPLDGSFGRGPGALTGLQKAQMGQVVLMPGDIRLYQEISDTEVTHLDPNSLG